MCNAEKRISTTSGTGAIGCPYFVAHGNRDIMCEGIIEGSRTVTKFRSAEEKTFHQETFCEKCWKKCEIYASVKHFRWDDE